MRSTLILFLALCACLLLLQPAEAGRHGKRRHSKTNWRGIGQAFMKEMKKFRNKARNFKFSLAGFNVFGRRKPWHYGWIPKIHHCAKQCKPECNETITCTQTQCQDYKQARVPLLYKSNCEINTCLKDACYDCVKSCIRGGPRCSANCTEACRGRMFHRGIWNHDCSNCLLENCEAVEVEQEEEEEDQEESENEEEAPGSPDDDEGEDDENDDVGDTLDKLLQMIP
uniref:Vanadium-binding protein X n=1 Tax=Ascidia sydneiensis samea TaxID=79730 RepID=A0A915WQ50_ASCSS|nr:vanadium-binding protein X [Ascidia sydneiensis samea]